MGLDLYKTQAITSLSPPTGQGRWLSLPQPGAAGGILLKGSFAFELSPSACSSGVFSLLGFSLYYYRVNPLCNFFLYK